MNILAYLILPILFFIYNTTETVGKLMGASFCESTGCLFAGNLLRFDSLYLNYLGVASALLIMIVGFLTYKQKIDKKFFIVLIAASLLFESIMLGYQYYAAPMMCKFCMGIWGFLFAMMIAASRSYILFLLPLLIAPLLALSFLGIPKTQAYTVEDGRYLIQSPTCPHCKKVKAYFKEYDIDYKKLDINTPEAKNFATFLNFSTIPIMIVKEGEHIEIINGDEAILASFQTPQESDKAPAAVSIGDGSQKEGGCGFFDISKVEESCDTDE